jgi:cysteine desulfurase
MKAPASALHGAIRFSFARENTDEDVDRVIEILPGVVSKLREMSQASRSEKAQAAASH